MDTQLFLDAIKHALETPDNTLLERPGALLIEAHAAANTASPVGDNSAVKDTADTLVDAVEPEP
jgi:hypothetical protein